MDKTEFRNAEHMLRKLEALCRPHGEVRRIDVFCAQRRPDEALCMIDLKGQLAQARQAVRGEFFGTATISRFEPLAPTFRCLGRPEGRLVPSECNFCHLAGNGSLRAGTPPAAIPEYPRLWSTTRHVPTQSASRQESGMPA